MLQFIQVNCQIFRKAGLKDHLMFDILGASKDFLTNCYNREGLDSFLGQMEMNYQIQKAPFSVFIIDVDHFKFFNDKYGHLCGDEVLKYFSSSIRLDLEEETNYAFRFGGDEFLVVFPNKTAKEVHILAERLRRNIKARPCLYKGQIIRMGFSGGIACYPEDTDKVQELLEKADRALYAVKKKGRGRVLTYSGMKREAMIQRTVWAILILGLAAWVLIVKDDAQSYLKKLVSDTKITLSSYRQTIEEKLSTFSQYKPESVAPSFQPIIKPLASTPTPTPVAPVVTVDVIYLKNGGVLRGEILSEEGDIVHMETKLSTGTGSVKLAKSEILNIERDVAA